MLVILAQNSKAAVLHSQFGGSAASNIIGVKKTGDLLEKLTWTFVILIMALALSTNFITPAPAQAALTKFSTAGEQAAPQYPGQWRPAGHYGRSSV